MAEAKKTAAAKKAAAKRPANKKTPTTRSRGRRLGPPRFRERPPRYSQLTVIHDTSIDVVIQKANEIFKAKSANGGEIDYGYGLRGRAVEFVNGEYIMLIEEMVLVEGTAS